MKVTILKAANVISLMVMFYITYLSITLPLGGRTTGELSDMYVSFFTPAGFTFMIWNLIYLGLIAFVLHSFFRKEPAGGDGDFVRKTGWLFTMSNLLNAGWLVAWHYNVIWLSILIMISLLVTLVRIYRRLEIGMHPVNWKMKWFVHVPFQLYLGWISVATVANFSAFLISLGLVLTTTTQQVISVLFMITVLYLSMRMGRGRGDVVYGLVISWALLGIGMKYLHDDRAMVWIGIPALVFSAGALVISLLTWRKKVAV